MENLPAKAPDGTLSAIETLPLCGRTLCVTRALEQAPAFAGHLAALGAQVITFPTIAIVEPDDDTQIIESLSHLADYAWIIFTSTNAVERFFEYAEKEGITEIPLGIKSAAVGTATAAALARFGIAPALIPEDYKAEGLIEEFDQLTADILAAGVDIEGQKILMPRALVAREILPTHLEKLGYVVTVAPVYKTVPAVHTHQEIAELLAAKPDGITFTSPSTARNFFASISAAGEDPLKVLDQMTVFSIGSITTDALLEAGMAQEKVVESAESTTQSLIVRILEKLS